MLGTGAGVDRLIKDQSGDMYFKEMGMNGEGREKKFMGIYM